jgi:hypothetical protein
VKLLRLGRTDAPSLFNLETAAAFWVDNCLGVEGIDLAELTTEEENKLIDAYGNIEFYDVMRKEFGAVGVAAVLGYATLYGLTGKQTPTEARAVLVSWGWSERGVYGMYQDFRRLRRALLANRGYTMHEQKGGPGANGGVPPVVARLRGLQSVY